jgi:hypothetical protein
MVINIWIFTQANLSPLESEDVKERLGITFEVDTS